MILNGKTRPEWDILAVLMGLSIVLIIFQYITLEKFQVLSPIVYFNLPGLLQLILTSVPLDFIDLILALLILSLFSILCLLEYRRKRFSQFLIQTFASNTRTRMVLALGSLVLVRFYFAPGAFHWMSDMASHISYAWLAANAFQHGEFPIWTNYLGTGGPYLQFYGFLFFYLVGLVDLIVRDITFSLKLVLSLLHILSGLGMYAFARVLCGSRQAGFAAALAYVLGVWHTQQIVIMGRLPLSVFYALLPWPFYFFEQLRFRSQKIPSTLGGSLTLGALPFVHPGYAFWATALLVFYIGVRFLAARSTWTLQNQGLYSLLIVLGGLVFGAYMTLPMWVEGKFVGLEEVSYSGLPHPSWKHLVYWSSYRLRLFTFPGQNWYGAYLGVSLLLPAGWGILRLIRRTHPRNPLILSSALCLIVSLILVLGYQLPGIHSLTIVRILHSGRYLLFVTFFLSVMVGCSIALAVPLLSHQLQNRSYTLLLLLILLDLGPTTFQHPYIPHETEKTLTHMSPELLQNLKNESTQFDNGELPNYRYFYISNTDMSFLPNAWIPTQVGIPSAFNAYLEDPLAAHKFCYPLYRFLNPTHFLRSDQPEKLHTILTGLYLLNTRHMFVYQSDSKNLLHWRLPNNTPIIASSSISGWENWKARHNLTPEPDQEIETLIQNMQINTRDHTCERIFLDRSFPQETLDGVPQIEILEHRVWNQRVILRLKATAPCFARLAYAYYPYLRITIHQTPVEPMQTAGGFIALRLESGEQEVVLEPYLSPLRRTLLIVNTLLLLIAVFVLFQCRKPKPLL